METFMAHFHFLRPLWLLASVPGLILFGFTWYMRVQSSRWNRAIDRSLLPHLLDTKQSRRQGWPLFVLLLAWLLTAFSLAGPAWQKLPQPVQKKEDALVIIQDLSLSMYARDLSPDRLTRAQHKLDDILDVRGEGSTALVVYSGDAHVVAPLTDDSRTIKSLVPALSPGIMPSYGSNVTEAVEKGLQLFKDGGIGQGRILLLTDEVAPEDVGRISRILRGKSVTLSVLGVGTEEGGPVPKSDGDFLKDSDGTIIIPRLNSPVLGNLAEKNGGNYREITLDDADIRVLLKDDPPAWQENTFRNVDREFDQWEEMGPWLLLVIVPLALLAFRRGWMVVLVCAVLLSGQTSYAMGWADLWQRKDQRAARALAEDDPEQAAELFTSPRWKAAARYRAGDYAGALEALREGESADDLYNRGNALAKAGKLEEAAAVYDQALALAPEMEDAIANKELVEKLIQQEKKQEKKQKQEQEKEQGKGKKGDKGKDKGKDSGEGEKDNQQGDQGKKQDDQSRGSEQQEQQDQQTGEENSQQGEGSDQQQEQPPGQDKENERSKAQSPAEQSKEKAQQTEKQQDSAGREEGEKDKSAPQPGNQKNEGEPAGPQGADSEDQLSEEEQQALEQWLRRIPDNPGGLLRRKFEYEYQRNRGEHRSGPNKKIW